MSVSGGWNVFEVDPESWNRNAPRKNENDQYYFRKYCDYMALSHHPDISKKDKTKAVALAKKCYDKLSAELKNDVNAANLVFDFDVALKEKVDKRAVGRDFGNLDDMSKDERRYLWQVFENEPWDGGDMTSHLKWGKGRFLNLQDMARKDQYAFGADVDPNAYIEDNLRLLNSHKAFKKLPKSAKQDYLNHLEVGDTAYISSKYPELEELSTAVLTFFDECAGVGIPVAKFLYTACGRTFGDSRPLNSTQRKELIAHLQGKEAPSFNIDYLDSEMPPKRKRTKKRSGKRSYRRSTSSHSKKRSTSTKRKRRSPTTKRHKSSSTTKRKRSITKRKRSITKRRKKSSTKRKKSRR